MAAKPAPPASVEEYLRRLPEDRRELVGAVRAVLGRHMPRGFEEGIQYGMIGWFVPHARYPAGYHCDPRQPLPYVSLASQKGHVSVYLMCVYGSAEHRAWFEQAWARTGKKLDMGKACVRFKRLEDVPLDVLGEAVARVSVDEYVAHYESLLPKSARRTQATAKKKAAAKTKATPKRQAAAKKPAARRKKG